MTITWCRKVKIDNVRIRGQCCVTELRQCINIATPPSNQIHPGDPFGHTPHFFDNQLVFSGINSWRPRAQIPLVVYIWKAALGGTIFRNAQTGHMDPDLQNATPRTSHAGLPSFRAEGRHI